MMFLLILTLIYVRADEYCFGFYMHGFNCKKDASFYKAARCYDWDECYLDGKYEKLDSCEEDVSFSYSSYSDKNCKDLIEKNSSDIACRNNLFAGYQDVKKICHFNRGVDNVKLKLFDDQNCTKYIGHMYVRKDFCLDNNGIEGLVSTCSKDGKLVMRSYNSTKCEGEPQFVTQDYTVGECTLLRYDYNPFHFNEFVILEEPCK